MLIKDLEYVKGEEVNCYSFNELDPFQENWCYFKTVSNSNGQKLIKVTECKNILGLNFYKIEESNGFQYVNNATKKKQMLKKNITDVEWKVEKEKIERVCKVIKKFGKVESLYKILKNKCWCCGIHKRLKHRLLCIKCKNSSKLHDLDVKYFKSTK